MWELCSNKSFKLFEYLICLRWEKKLRMVCKNKHVSLYLPEYNYTSKERTYIFFPFNQWQNWKYKVFTPFFLDVKSVFTMFLVTASEIPPFSFCVFLTLIYICDSFFTYFLYLKIRLIPTNFYYSKFQAWLVNPIA